MSWNDFMVLTPLEFFLTIEDHEQLEEHKVRIVADAIRYSAWWNVNVQIKKKIRSVQKMWGHPWDGRVEKDAQSRTSMSNTMRAIAKDTEHKKPMKKKK